MSVSEAAFLEREGDYYLWEFLTDHTTYAESFKTGTFFDLASERSRKMFRQRPGLIFLQNIEESKFKQILFLIKQFISHLDPWVREIYLISTSSTLKKNVWSPFKRVNSE